MAIARDNTAKYEPSTATAISFSYTCSGSNRLLITISYAYNAMTTAPTYNGVSMTQIGGNLSGAALGLTVNMWYLVAPATGSNTFAMSGGTGNEHGVMLISYTGVNQSSPINTSLSTTKTGGTPFNCSVTTTTNNCWGVLLGAVNGISASTNCTLQQSRQYVSIFDNNGVITPAGSYTMTFTGSGGNADVLMCAIAPVPPPVIYSLTCTPASFTLTGQSIGNFRNIRMICQPASFIFTGLSTIYDRWSHAVKHLSTWVSQNKSN